MATDRASLEAAGECYADFREDWSHAYDALIAKGLVEGNDDGYRLTESGRPRAQAWRLERPDMYWYYYQKFYPAAHASPTHSKFCEIVFGRDLCQEGQTDMESLAQLLERLDLKAGESLLDLGCGSGVISEYISDLTGASVIGVDYAARAIEEANRRTREKRSRLKYLQADFNEFELSPASLDAAIAIDTLYQDEGLADIIARVTRALKPGGRFGIFLNYHIQAGEAPERLAVEYSILSRILTDLGLRFETRDYNAQLLAFWNRLYRATVDLRAEFEAEGNGFIAENYLRESEGDHLREIEAGTIARALYLVRC